MSSTRAGDPTLRETAGALVVFGLAAVALTWPVAARLTEPDLVAVSAPFDALIHPWNFDWLRDALATGHSPLRTDRLSYPNEVPLALYTPTYALGPQAKWLEQPTGVPLPWAWLEGVLPPLRITRVPARFLVRFSLGAALLAGAVVDAVPRRLALRRNGRAAFALVAGLAVALEGTQGWPLTMLDPVTPRHVPISSGLTERGGAVVDLPFDVHHTRRLAMFHQIEHGRPVLYATYPRAPRDNVSRFRAVPLFDALADAGEDADTLAARLATLALVAQGRALRETGIDAVVLHHRFYERVVGAGDLEGRRLLARGVLLRSLLARAWGAPTRLDAGSYELFVFALP